jgi:Xaa-Pro aminopeptidase
MEEQSLSSLLVTNLTNIAYLTGFRGSAGIALFTSREGVLWVDPRYALQAQEQARGLEVIEERKGLLRAVGERLKRNKDRRVGYEVAHLICADFSGLQQGVGRQVSFVPATGLVEQLRAVKDGGGRRKDPGRGENYGGGL